MSERNYWVLCDDNCRFPAMTKEQILAAIAQAVESGEIHDVDTGFVQTIKTINGVPLRFFVGQQSEYELLSDEEKENLFAIITNDTAKESIELAIKQVQDEMKTLNDGLCDGSIAVTEAVHAQRADYANSALNATAAINAVNADEAEEAEIAKRALKADEATTAKTLDNDGTVFGRKLLFQPSSRFEIPEAIDDEIPGAMLQIGGQGDKFFIFEFEYVNARNAYGIIRTLPMTANTDCIIGDVLFHCYSAGENASWIELKYEYLTVGPHPETRSPLALIRIYEEL